MVFTKTVVNTYLCVVQQNVQAYSQLIKTEAKNLGFMFCGIAKAEFLEEEAPRLEAWLNKGMHGEMRYMENYFDKRLDPRLLVDGAKSVISLGLNYYNDQSQHDPFAPKISKYAYGTDYHTVIKDKLRQLLAIINESIGEVGGRAFVDSAPVLDKAWAKKAGLGWVGKNSNLISKKAGSFFFLAELILDIELAYDVEPTADHCGDCTRCIDACPTDAIVGPYIVDGSRCISYLTIELKNEIPQEFSGKMDNWMFGCDVCQDVCPWNRFSVLHQEDAFAPHPDLHGLKKQDWEDITTEVFQKVFKNSAVKRTKFEGLKRNIDFFTVGLGIFDIPIVNLLRVNIKLKLFAVGLLIVACAACKKPFMPAVTSGDASYLVVEGVINSGNDSTIIKLSHSYKIDSTKFKVETGARVLVESDKNDTYTLTELKPGKYIIPQLNLPTDRNYRIHIFTTDNKEYASDFVENKITPPIDTITYKPTATGVQFYASAHDNSSKTKYYRWDYDETWSYTARYISWFVYNNPNAVPRRADSVIYNCYRFATPSNNSVVSSSVKLSNDVVSNFPVGYVDAKTGKLAHEYSVNLKQYAITREAFNYWELLKKNTEKLGSIFDASPSELIGNIHCISNPGEMVLGYASVSTISYKRIFIAGRELPFYTTIKNPNDPPADVCAIKLAPLKPAETLAERLFRTFASGDTLFADATFNNDTKEMIAYKYAPKICIDCRLLGGTINRPSYWIDK